MRPNGATLCTEKSQIFMMIETIFFLLFIYLNDWLQNHCLLSVKSMTASFVDAVSVLLPINSYIGSGMSYLCIFVEEVGVKTCLWSELDHKQ